MQRLLYDNVQPRTEVDKVALAHDLRYSFAESPADIRQADIIMMNKVKDIEKKKQDNPFNIAQTKLIGVKIGLENIGILKKGSFGALDEPKEFNEEQGARMRTILNGLAQQGYGRRRRI
jgi:hypothetical protein